MGAKIIAILTVSILTHAQANANCNEGQLLVSDDIRQAQEIARNFTSFIYKNSEMLTVGEGIDAGFAGYNYEPAIQALQKLTPAQRQAIVDEIINLRGRSERTVDEANDSASLIASLKNLGLAVPAEFDPLIQIGREVNALRLAPSQGANSYVGFGDPSRSTKERSRSGLLPEGEGPRENYPYVEEKP